MAKTKAAASGATRRPPRNARQVLADPALDRHQETRFAADPETPDPGAVHPENDERGGWPRPDAGPTGQEG